MPFAAGDSPPAHRDSNHEEDHTQDHERRESDAHAALGRYFNVQSDPGYHEDGANHCNDGPLTRSQGRAGWITRRSVVGFHSGGDDIPLHNLGQSTGLPARGVEKVTETTVRGGAMTHPSIGAHSSDSSWRSRASAAAWFVPPSCYCGHDAGSLKLESGTSSMSRKSSFGHGSVSALDAITHVNPFGSARLFVGTVIVTLEP